MSSYILSIDQGTSSTKTLIFDASGTAVAKGTEPLLTHYLPNGFVEQDPHEILKNVRASVAQCLQAFEAKGSCHCCVATGEESPCPIRR